MRRHVDAQHVADRTQNAYSFDRYGEQRWLLTISRFLDAGYTDREVEAIMRSKWTRWAMDAQGKRASSLALVRYLVNAFARHPGEVEELTRETFA